MWKNFVNHCFCCYTEKQEIDDIVHLTHIQTKFNTDVEPTIKNPKPVSMVNPIMQYPNRQSIEGHIVIDNDIINISEYDFISRSEITDESNKEKKTMTLSSTNPFKDDINYEFNDT